MLSAVSLSSVCLSSVTLVHPTQAVELFGNFFQAEDGIRDAQESRGLGDVYKRQYII